MTDESTVKTDHTVELFHNIVQVSNRTYPHMYVDLIYRGTKILYDIFS